MKSLFTKRRLLGLAGVLFMLFLWKVLAWHFASDFILPHPEHTLVSTFKLFGQKTFVIIVGTTVLRGVVGFIISGVLGLLMGIIAGISPHFNSFLQPILVTVRSIPVVALILLALIWFQSGMVPVFIGFLTMFPFICTNVIDGIRSVDTELVQMAQFYRIGRPAILRQVYIPAIMPFIVSGASSALGIGWRAIIIGEVLSQPRYGIGTVMQSAQTFLNVDAVIAWTIIAVAISYGFERAIRWGEHRIMAWKF